MFTSWHHLVIYKEFLHSLAPKSIASEGEYLAAALKHGTSPESGNGIMGTGTETETETEYGIKYQ